MEESKYLEFLRFCLNPDLPVPECIATINWHGLLEFAVKQTIPGLFIPTLLMKNGRLTMADFKGNKPTDDDVMEWMYEELRIRKQNTILFERTQKASEWFLENGFRNCILKGQGNAIMYPEPFLRSCGDVDIWLEGTREEILAFTTKFYHQPASSIHVHFPMFTNAEVEVHFWPSRLYNPYKNKKLWKYFKEMGPSQFSNKITTPDGKYTFFMPTNEFNAFFQLDHVFRHFIFEGVGLRQVIDYFYLLRKRREEGATAEDDKKLIALLKRFNMYKFARAMMYLQHHVLGLDEKYLYAKPNEKEGKFLLEEMLYVGNFAHYDDRAKNKLEGVEGHVKRFWALETFKMRLFKHYPSEAIWMPYRDFKIWRSEKKKEKLAQKKTEAKD